MVVLRAWAAVSAVAFFAAMAAGCGSGLSKEEADIRCDQDKAALGFSETVYTQCEECYMQCGDECVRNSSTPISYACSDGAPSSTSTTTDTSK